MFIEGRKLLSEGDGRSSQWEAEDSFKEFL